MQNYLQRTRVPRIDRRATDSHRRSLLVMIEDDDDDDHDDEELGEFSVASFLQGWGCRPPEPPTPLSIES